MTENIKFTLQIDDTKEHFKVHVYKGKRKVHEFSWYGGYFKWAKKDYMVLGPYHSIEPGDKFKVYELVPVSEKF
jgi:hypothetical protein